MTPRIDYGLVNHSLLFSTANATQERHPWVTADSVGAHELCREILTKSAEGPRGLIAR
jgi:hypothetical protein